MLVEQKYKKGDVIALKTLQGEEIIGKITSEDMIEWVLDTPVQLVVVDKQLGMAPVMQSADPKGMSFAKVNIAIHGKARDEMKIAYTEQTSGILTPEKPGLIVN